MSSNRLAALVSFLFVLIVATASPVIAEAAASTGGVSPDWWSRAQEDIRSSEYEITWQADTRLPDLAAAWHAPNRAHGFRTYFTERGIRVIPRTEEQPAWEWGLALVRYGRGGAPVSAEAARLLAGHNRLDYDRGAIREWYVNSERGLEQGFTLAAPPGASGGPVRIEMELAGTLSPVIAADGQAVDFATPGGVYAIHYAELVVTDSRGLRLPACMEGYAENGARGVRLVIDDREAAYPLTIDPLATSPAWTVDGNQASAELGFAVSTAGDVNGDGHSDVIVGAHGYDNGQTNEGRIYVYYGTASGLPATPSWTAESNVTEARFGRTVSTAGDVNGDGYSDILVGAQYYTNTLSGEGAVFAYYGGATGLDQGGARPSGTNANADWRIFGGQANAYLGNSVATAGDVTGDGYSDVIVAAWRYDNGETDEGRVYVYYGGSSGLQTAASWMAESNQAGADFGSSVATGGDVNGDGYSDIIVGAWRYTNGQAEEGRAFVWYGSSGGLGPSGTPANADWTAESDQAYARLGSSVSTAGDVNGNGYSDIVLGAPLFDSAVADEGAAFVYHGGASGLDNGSRPVGNPGNADFAVYGGQADARLGTSVSTAGDVDGDGYGDIAVAAPNYDVFAKPSPFVDAGRVLVHFGSPTGLSSSPTIVDTHQTSTFFGTCVSTAGDVNGDGYSDLIVGASAYDDLYTDEGRAFLYLGAPAGISAAAVWTGDIPVASTYYGYAVASAGDVNGDGYADVVVSAPYYANGEVNEGRVFVYYGSFSGLPAATSPSWTAESNQAGALFGWSVASAGDVNGDGYSDLIVGSSDYLSGGATGAAWVYYGSSTGLDKNGTRPVGTLANADWSKADTGGGNECGFAVAGAGDVNGDGYWDVAVGCPGYLGGRVDLHYGSATGLSSTASWSVHKDEAGAQLGYAVASAGDVNGDGYSDLVAGTYSGWAYVFHGSASGLDQFGHRPTGGHAQAADWTATAANICFGCAVAGAGDVNGDGYSDVIIGAPYYSDVATNQGMALVYHGSSTGLDKAGTRPVGYTSNADWSKVESTGEAWYGFSAASAGDVNGDGYSDSVVGAAHSNVGYVYHGSPSGLSSTASFSGAAGWSVASAGDVNGDGYADVVFGDYFYGGNGHAAVHFGNDGFGYAVLPRQRRYSNSVDIAPLGRSDYVGAFRLSMTGRTPFGRSRVKLEKEVKPLGMRLDGTGTEISPWYDTGTAGIGINRIASTTSPGIVYHWRMRLHYDPVRTPFQQRGRWITVPWNGWQEGDLRTGCAMAVVPSGITVSLSKAGVTATISWVAVAYATAYDTVAGSLGALRNSGGDFALATDLCLGANLPDTSVDDARVPAVGDGFFYVVRGENCLWVGTYDDGSPSQQGDRDTEIYECP